MPYITRQQKAVLEHMKSHSGSSLSAQALAKELRAEGERVGIATVYRQLDRLEQSERIHKALTEDGALYQYCTAGEHENCFLLKCERCGTIEHATCERVAPLYRHLEDEHGFRVNPHRTIFCGVCASCREAEA